MAKKAPKRPAGTPAPGQQQAASTEFSALITTAKAVADKECKAEIKKGNRARVERRDGHYHVVVEV